VGLRRHSRLLHPAGWRRPRRRHPRLARYLLEDFQHYASARKPLGRKALLIVDEFSALRVPGAAALLERLRSYGVGVVIASQSVEGLHDDPGERARVLGAASTVIAHRLADPELIAERAGTVQRAERSHQLDHLGATGMGSLRIQETYRIDPNDLRNLPAGVAWITTAGRAAKVAIAASQAQQTLPTERRRPGKEHVSARTAHVTLSDSWATADGPEEVGFVEVRLMPRTHSAAGPEPSGRQELGPNVEQQTLPINDAVNEPPGGDQGQPGATTEERDERREEFGSPPDAPSRRVSPYAEGL